MSNNANSDSTSVPKRVPLVTEEIFNADLLKLIFRAVESLDPAQLDEAFKRHRHRLNKTELNFALSLAVKLSQSEMVSLLIDNGADPLFGNTMFLWSLRSEDLKTARILLGNLDKTLIRNHLVEAMKIAVARDNKEMIEMLAETGLKIPQESMKPDPRRAFDLFPELCEVRDAVIYQAVLVCLDKELLKREGPKETQGIRCMLPIISANEEEEEEMEVVKHEYKNQGGIDMEAIQLMLDMGANANTKGLNGRTALHEAACAGHHELTDLLLSMEADELVADYEDKLPWMRALSDAKDEHLALKLLKMETGKVISVDKQERHMQAACGTGNVQYVQFLLYQGLSVSLGYKNGVSPLIRSIRENYFDLSLLLIPLSIAEINYQDSDMNTPLSVAVTSFNCDSLKQIKVMDCLIEHGASMEKMYEVIFQSPHVLVSSLLVSWLSRNGFNIRLLPDNVVIAIASHLSSGMYKEVQANTALLTLVNCGMKIPCCIKTSFVHRALASEMYQTAMFFHVIGCIDYSIKEKDVDLARAQRNALYHALVQYILDNSEREVSTLQNLSRECILENIEPGFVPEKISQLPIPRRVLDFIDWRNYICRKSYGKDVVPIMRTYQNNAYILWRYDGK